MKKLDLVNTLTRTLGKTGLKLQKYSPEILVVTGIVGVVVSAVMACKATTKASEIVEDMNEKMDTIHEVSETATSEEYSEEDLKKDTTIVYVQTGVKFLKLYGPSLALGALSIGCILASAHILKTRNLALAAAYSAIDKGFKDYRGRVIERFGKDLDRELRYNIKAKTIEENIVDENGEVNAVEKTVEVVNPNEHSIYAKCFDESCAGWSKDPEFNLMFIRRQQDYANEVLTKRGYIFLNEVYKMLGFQATKAGQIVGWFYDPENPDHTGDNYVDFGIYDVHKEKNRDFVNGYERCIWLDFNVDGNILDLI